MLEKLTHYFSRRKQDSSTSLLDYSPGIEGIIQAKYDLTTHFERGNFQRALPALRFIADESDNEFDMGLMFVDFYLHDFFLTLVIKQEYELAEEMVKQLQHQRYSFDREPLDERQFREVLYDALSGGGYLGAKKRWFWFDRLPRSTDFQRLLPQKVS